MTDIVRIMHHVIPNPVYAQYHKLITLFTQGKFDQNAMYNIVFLPVEAEDALRENLVMYGTDSEPLIRSVAESMDHIAGLGSVAEQNKSFMGAHSHFRGALSLDAPHPTFINRNDPRLAAYLGVTRRHGSSTA